VSTISKLLKPKRAERASTRVNLRIDPKTKALLVQASKAQHLKLTEFMVRSSQTAAEMALADRTHFVLPAEKWAQFNAALDAPPRDIPALRKLLREKSIFDSE